MSRPPSVQSTPQFFRVSDRDLTEVELHSVDSISDLHRTHPDHSHKGTRPPRPHHTPSPNGVLLPGDGGTEGQKAPPPSSKWQSCLLRPSPPRASILACAVITLLLLTVLLIFYFLVQQGGFIRQLTEAVREKEAAASELMLLVQELQELRRNLTAMRRGS